jgi:hypothetical protein
MIKYGRLSLMISACFVMAASHAEPQTVEEACTSRGRLLDARVRVGWTAIATVYRDVTVSYCVLRGDRTARLDFERDADIVYFGLASEDIGRPWKNYAFTITTSTGRVIRQGPALLKPVAREPQSCRVEVCQFFTNPGERVVTVSVVTAANSRGR